MTKKSAERQEYIDELRASAREREQAKRAKGKAQSREKRDADWEKGEKWSKEHRLLSNVITAGIFALIIAIPVLIWGGFFDNVKLESVGWQGMINVVYLKSPDFDELIVKDLIDQLVADYDHMNAVHASIFDNKATATFYLDKLIEADTMSDAEWKAVESSTYPHLFAIYAKNTTSGLHELTIYAQDAELSPIKTYKLP